jgi:hypothetical protein
MNKFVVVVKKNMFVRFLGELGDTKKSFQDYLTCSFFCKFSVCARDERRVVFNVEHCTALGGLTVILGGAI